MDMLGLSAYILVDFDNFFTVVTGYESLKSDIETMCSVVIEKIIDKPEINEIRFKFYGGWYNRGVFTQKASKLAAIIAEIGFSFTIIKDKRLVRCYLEIVKTLMDYEDYTFINTLKEKEGLPRARVSKTIDLSICESNKNTCPVKIMNRFTAHGNKLCSVTNCTHVNKAVFSAPQQKMVDTLIACDLISLSLKAEVGAIYLLSEDIDCVPPLILAARLSIERNDIIIVVLYKRDNLFDLFTQVFGTNKIQLDQWT